MATQEEQQILRQFDDVDSAVNILGQHLTVFRKDLFSGKYRTNFMNSEAKLLNDLRYVHGVLNNADQHVLNVINLARANNIMPSVIDNIEILNDHMVGTYDEVQRIYKERARISALMQEMIDTSKEIRKLLRVLYDGLMERLPPRPLTNQNGSSRKHKQRKHRKRTHRKHRK